MSHFTLTPIRFVLTPKRYAGLFIIGAGICWGIIGLFSNLLSAGGCSPVQITFLRSLITAVCLWIWLALTDRRKLKIHLKDLWMFLGTGMLSIVLFNVLYFMTIESTTLSLAVILLYTAPCFVMILSAILFREKITPRKAGAFLLALLGCACTTGGLDASSFSVFGILTGVGSGFCYALYTIFGNIALKKYHPLTVTSYTFLIASLTLLPFCDIAVLPEMLSAGNLFLPALALGLLSTLTPFLLYTAGLRYIDGGKASVMAFVEPMVGTLVGICFLHEPLTLIGMAGVTLMFGSIVLLNLHPRPRRTCT